jgi:hypothetical protein
MLREFLNAPEPRYCPPSKVKAEQKLFTLLSRSHEAELQEDCADGFVGQGA